MGCSPLACTAPEFDLVPPMLTGVQAPPYDR
jgi:hypothetical protein